MSALNEKTILIIGGSSGIELRVAELASHKGANLTVIVGRDRERLDAARHKLLQSSSRDARRRCARPCAARGAVRAVASVGSRCLYGRRRYGRRIPRRTPVGDPTRARIEVLHQCSVAQLAAPKLRQGGSVVFTSGTGGRAQDTCGSYVGNLGINALVEGMAAELAPAVRVNAISPTWTPTPFWRDMAPDRVAATRKHFEAVIPLHRLANVGDLAAGYLFLMSNGFVTGQHVAIDGGIMLGK